MKRTKAILGIVAVFVAGSLIVSAGLLQYYGKIEANAEVNQAVVVQGRNWNEPIVNDFEISAGCMEAFKYKVINQACVEAGIEIVTQIDGHGKGPDGVYVSYYEMPGWLTLRLENKDANWEVIDDEYWADFTWNPCCPLFNWEIEGMFMPDTEYVLIYYADQPDRFVNWGGAPALELAMVTTDATGAFSASGSMNLDACIPFEDDWNIGPDADYTQPPDNYVHGKGAKIWLVPSAIYDGVDHELTDWVPDEILFETDLIIYCDCDINPLPKYLYDYFTMGDMNQIGQRILQPGEEICLFILYRFDVAIMPGAYTIKTTIVPYDPQP